jgi:hypothetical protein
MTDRAAARPVKGSSDIRRAPERQSRFALGRVVFGDPQTIAGTVYGTIIVMSVLAVGAKPYQHALWRLVVLMAASSVVLWLAHVYAHAVGESLKLGRRLTLAQYASVARREYSIVLAAVAPVAAVALGAISLVSEETAIGLAFGFGVLTLTAQGVRYSRLERLSLTGTLATAALNLLIGLALVAAEVFIAH